MRSPEEVAREIAHPILHHSFSSADAIRERIAGFIRERDAEVAAAQRDVTLVGFEWETTPGPIGTWNGPARRLVGPWEPVEP